LFHAIQGAEILATDRDDIHHTEPSGFATRHDVELRSHPPDELRRMSERPGRKRKLNAFTTGGKVKRGGKRPDIASRCLQAESNTDATWKASSGVAHLG